MTSPHEFAPFIFPNTPDGLRKRDQFAAEHNITNLIDAFAQDAKEYALLRDPQMLFSGKPSSTTESKEEESNWVVYPWRNCAVSTLDKEAFRALRLSRNNDLITKEEQEKLQNSTIAFAGLNVGNPGAVCMALEGIGQTYRMADNDALSLSNLNRFRAGLPDIGINKAVLSARQVAEIDPYYALEVYPDGVSTDNLAQFLDGADILIEEMDHLQLKIAIREEARKRKIPVVMVTGSGHDIILDIERYDLDPNLPILGGHLDTTVQETIKKNAQLKPEEKLILARDFMGSGILSPRLNSSFDNVGKTLIGIPQLAEASFLRGAALAHATRDILLGEAKTSGRYIFGLSDLYTKAK